MNCDCKGSGYISDGSGVAFDNMQPCKGGCGMFEGEQIIIGVRGPKGERIEVLDCNEGGFKLLQEWVESHDFQGPIDVSQGLLRAWTRYKKIKT